MLGLTKKEGNKKCHPKHRPPDQFRREILSLRQINRTRHSPPGQITYVEYNEREWGEEVVLESRRRLALMGTDKLRCPDRKDPERTKIHEEETNCCSFDTMPNRCGESLLSVF
mmetsp:Transcript_40055/g.96713  ORF Transcript_40055/g.96713 Transcript_40055/m.96713 type:complete len:113 (-) Transcript_40055:1831-2169(-)